MTVTPLHGTSAAALIVTGVRKTYSGVVALADGNLAVQKGEIHGLLGQNGAGKSTLIKALAGTPAPDAGTIIATGNILPPNHSARQAAEAGLAFIHQEGALVETLTVEENIALSVGFARRRGGLIDWKALRRTAREALDLLGVDLDPGRLVAELPLATRTVVAIARALAQRAEIVVLDEPTASVSPEDAQALFVILRRLRAAGKALVFVSHRLDEVLDLCDRVTILRDGQTVAASVPVAGMDQHRLIELICGHKVTFGVKRPVASVAAAALEIEGLKGPAVGPLSLSIRPGEIVGLTGLSDSGADEVGEMLFGLTPRLAGEVRLGSRPLTSGNPAQAMGRGVSYIPPDRNRLGLARDMSLAENLFLNPRPGLRMPNRERAEAQALLDRFQVRPADPDAPIATLSGGNAQKVLVARWLKVPATLLIINDPTVGVDVGAREEIYACIRHAADDGAAILLISGDFDEIEALCNMALVLVRGTVRATLSGDAVTQTAITAALAARSNL